MDKNYLELIDNKYNEFKESADSYERVINEITFIESFIPEFFSVKGEAKGIKKMYSDIKDVMSSPLFESDMEFVDLNKSSHIYREYLDGMGSFIQDINELTSDVQLESFEEKFEIAREKDSAFIKSLYGGSLNKYKVESITEATSNIEFLIDFIPELKLIKEKCNKVHDCYQDDGSTKSRLLLESLDMMYESVSDYCYNSIRNVIETYESIQDEIAGNHNNNIEEDDNFILF